MSGVKKIIVTNEWDEGSNIASEVSSLYLVKGVSECIIFLKMCILSNYYQNRYFE